MRPVFLALCLLAGVWYPSTCEKALDEFKDPADEYFSNTKLEAYLHAFAEECGDIAKLHEIGRTALDTPLYALEISDNAGQPEPEPYFRYIANMHGDEPTGRVHLLKLAEWLCEGYRMGEALAVRMVNDMHLFLMPTMNPDGFAAHRRENSNHVDLNRNFPDRFHSDSMEGTGKEEAETQAVMAFTLEYPFVAAANLHEGALVANYPWDSTEDGGRRYNASPDDDTYVYFAHLYADTHPTMHLPDREFPDGITNGAAWYVIYGSMQDWTYVRAQALSLTLELSRPKSPPAHQLQKLWSDNRDALIALASGMALGGIHGTCSEGLGSRQLLSQATSGQPLACWVMLDGQETATWATERFGDFHRVVAPGKHVLKVGMEGYQDVEVEVEVPEDGSGVRVEVVLESVDTQGSAVGKSD